MNQKTIVKTIAIVALAGLVIGAMLPALGGF